MRIYCPKCSEPANSPRYDEKNWLRTGAVMLATPDVICPITGWCLELYFECPYCGLQIHCNPGHPFLELADGTQIGFWREYRVPLNQAVKPGGEPEPQKP